MDRFSFRHYQFSLKHDLIRPDMNVLVQVSGGSDSVCAAVLAEHFKEKLTLNTLWIHFNHNLRQNAALDEAFVRSLSEKYGVPLLIFRKDSGFSGKNFQSEARQWRMGIIENIVKQHSIHRILSGHQLDDLVETFFWRISRGTSLFGLSLIRPLEGIKARPIIYTEKDEIKTYLNEINQEWREDESNTKNTYTRNKIRNKLIPKFEQLLGKSYKQKIIMLSQDAAQLDELFTPKTLSLLNNKSLTYSQLTSFSKLLTRELLSRWFKAHNIVDVPSKKIQKLCDTAHSNIGNIEIELGKGISVLAKHKTLRIIDKND